MTVKAYKIYLPLFVVLLLLQLYLPSFKVNALLQIAVFGGIVLFDHVSLSKGITDVVKPFIILFAIGFIGCFIGKYHLYNIIKDLFHFIKPITGLLLGYVILKKVNNLKLFLQSIVVAGVLSSLIHFFIIVFFVGFSTAIEDIRLFTRDNFLDLIALFVLVSHKRFFGIRFYKNKILYWGVLLLLLLSCILYFSRTMFIMAFILWISLYGFTRITPVTLRILGVFAVLVVLLFVYLQNANIRRDAKGIQGFLYKVKIAPAEIMQTRVDRENHAQLWDHWRGYEASRAMSLMKKNPYSFVVGTGHGSLVNLKFKAPLSGDDQGMRYISELHNGYMYVFYKTGAVGMIIYLSILFWWYSYIYRKRHFINMLVSAIALFYLFSSLTITGIYNPRDIVIFILGGALYFAGALERKPVKPIADASPQQA